MTLTTALIFGLLGQAAPSDVPPAPARVSSGVSEPRKLKHVAPKYPDDARRAGLAQAVVLECLVDPRGRVSKVDVLEGVPPLTDAAISAVKQWRYTPTVLDGVPTPVIMTVTVNFLLSETRYDDLLDSLDDENEHIRAAAARNLGGQRVGGSIPEDDRRRAIRELEGLAKDDPSLEVRAAAAASSTRLDGRPLPPESPPPVDPPPPVADADLPELALTASDVAPRVLKQARPSYPQDAFLKRIEGTVLIEALIDIEGRVARCRVLQSVPELDAAALAAVRKWRFEPARRGGRPVATIVHMPVNFRIYDRKP